MATSVLDIASIATQSPIATALGFLNKKKSKKAKKKAKRKAKRQRQAAADALESQGVAPAQARQIVAQQSAMNSPVTSASQTLNPDGTPADNPLMKDFIGLGQMLGFNKPVPTIPLAAGLYFVLPKLKGMMGGSKRVYRRRKTSRRRRR